MWIKYYERLDRATCEGEQGMLKVITKKGFARSEVLWACCIGGPAGDIIQILSNAINNRWTLQQLGEAVFPYPSWSESIKHIADQQRNFYKNTL
jgi:pyruvate/2-oxoglutarate dehydrogenase complex dihydrolipoamide dehydrogenase (E3) component